MIDYSGFQLCSNRENQPASRLVSCSNSPESSQTPPHLSQESISTPSKFMALKLPSHRGQRIEEGPAAFASAATEILERIFSMASWFFLWKYSSSKPRRRSSNM